jgi:transcription elongation factor GreA
MTEITYLTREGFEKLAEELRRYMTIDRPEISKQIAEARDKGDLSENAEYDAAKDAQAMLEMKIAQLEDIIANARIIEENEIDNSKVYILSTVRVKNHSTGKESVYTLVSETESDHKSGRISVKSPIGKALIGKVVGDIVDIEVPAGVIKLEIMKIGR